MWILGILSSPPFQTFHETHETKLQRVRNSERASATTTPGTTLGRSNHLFTESEKMGEERERAVTPGPPSSESPVDSYIFKEFTKNLLAMQTISIYFYKISICNFIHSSFSDMEIIVLII